MECWKTATYGWVYTFGTTFRGRDQYDLVVTIEKLCVLRTQLEDLLTRSTADIEKNRSVIVAARRRGETVRSQLIVKLLKRSIFLKQERIGITNKMATVETQISALESSDFNHNMLATMQRSADTMRKMGLEKGLQLADTTISELEENIHVAGEMQQALGMSVSDTHLNDDELDAELDEIMGQHESSSDPHQPRRVTPITVSTSITVPASITVPPFAVESSMHAIQKENDDTGIHPVAV
jgi:hypothetical protein